MENFIRKIDAKAVKKAKNFKSERVDRCSCRKMNEYRQIDTNY